MKKNILFVNYSLGIGGIETLLLRHCKYLVDSDSSYFPHFLFFQSAKTNLQNEFEESGINVIGLSKKAGIDIKLVFNIIRKIKENKIDIVHAHNQSTWLYVAIACLITRKPLLVTIHTGVEKFQNKKQQKRWRLLSYFLSFFTTKITTVAEYIKNDLLDIGISKNKIMTVYNGIDVSRFKSKENIGSAKNDFLMVARFFPQKNHIRLISAFKKVNNKFPESKLYLAGIGELMDECKKKVIELNLNDSVIFLGYQNDIGQLLRKYKYYILPSTIEGLSISLLEAMSSKRVIMVSSIDSNMEVITDGYDGFLFDPYDEEDMADCMLRVLSNKDDICKISEQAYHTVSSRFSFNVMMNNYIQLYKQCLK